MESRPDLVSTATSDTANHYRAHWLRLLRMHLAQARSGELDVDWRDNIAPLSSVHDRAGRFTDAEIVAVAGMQDYPLSAWEPHRAGTWKEALGSWFATERWALMLELQLANDEWPFVCSEDDAGGMVPASVLPSELPGRGYVVDELYLMACDRLAASYFAGLSGGGEWPPGAWVGWYEQRIAKWGNRSCATAELKWLNNLSSCDRFEALPAYWTDSDCGRLRSQTA